MAKNKVHFTDAEKSTPAYRKKIEEENSQLKKSLESIQNQSSILQQTNSELEKENILHKERLKGSGITSFIKDIALLTGGSGITYTIDKNYQSACILLIIAFVLLLFSFQATNIELLIRTLIQKIPNLFKTKQ